MDNMNYLDILVVEDDADARANLHDILEMDGHRVVSFGTADEALRHRDLGRFGAIILDRKLPDTTADEVLPAIRQAAPEASVIIVTGYADLHGAIAALRQGASDYILKPLNPDALRANLVRIAEHRRLARAKERSEAAFRQLVEAAECLIVIVRPDRSILYFNPFAARVTGYSVEEVLAKPDNASLFSESVRKSIGELVDRMLVGERAGGHAEQVTRRSGECRWIVWNARRLDDFEDGEAILGVGQDITELKRAQDRALQSERLAAIGQVVAGLAHESRNALQRSQACLEMLALADGDRPKSLDLIARIGRAQDDLHHLFEDVRDYAAPIRVDRRPIRLHEVWREAWADLKRLQEGRTVMFREACDSDDLTCFGDPFRLGQVFRNLFDNSLAACPDPVEILVRCDSTEIEGRPALRISVLDNGPGLDADQSSNLFDPFYTTKVKGTGLGLAISRRIIDAHGGLIQAGDPGRAGAEIIIIIPKEGPCHANSESSSPTTNPT
ncbi:ATP-binding protein [Tundrisphaera lichenicola]|uniref:two-component system sensor histidine kinase NtrB n=1 Tax=Tundrisphaera lichenicola TaxID=2029860 RepID=UPI003EB7591C